MRFFTEFIDDGEKTAVEKLNEYIERAKIATNGKAKINVIGYQVARYEQMNKERTYILVEEVIE
nr:MAG TPA: hypothetical protein [Caudoviricetes sp.]DAT73797.1 MAG TPA: hypothetical protein [Caudoviricetes sp.]